MGVEDGCGDLSPKYAFRDMRGPNLGHFFHRHFPFFPALDRVVERFYSKALKALQLQFEEVASRWQ